MGSALAWMDHSFYILTALAALCVALLLQIGSNVANDVYDFERGADTSERFGPVRVTQTGLLTPAQMKRGMWIAFGLAAPFGLILRICAAGRSSCSAWPPSSRPSLIRVVRCHSGITDWVMFCLSLFRPNVRSGDVLHANRIGQRGRMVDVHPGRADGHGYFGCQ